MPDTRPKPEVSESTEKINGVPAPTPVEADDGKLIAYDHGTTSFVMRAFSAITGFATAVRDTVLTGLSTATNAVITAADSVLVALGKLQAQITEHLADLVTDSDGAHGLKIEEGTWTPGISGGGNTSPAGYQWQTGYYIKVGKRVTVNFSVRITTKGSLSGDLEITGLPFTSKNSTRYFSTNAFVFAYMTTGSGASHVLAVAANKTKIAIVKNIDNSYSIYTQASDMADAALMYGSIEYQTD